ncbi:PadR family transcriptional regulator [Sphingomicrobium sp. XHP0235]|uniref:PadR family transcriptional regulator n=1 Tax=Sphingomicrobium aquimarinum TaxID=3133971 RepID=UPI0031FECBEB
MTRSRRPSPQQRKLLAALSENASGWMHGYELMKATDLLSGTLYPLLMRMEDRGLLESRWLEPAEPGRPPRHAYRLTADGLTFALAQRGSSDTSDSRMRPA